MKKKIISIASIFLIGVNLFFQNANKVLAYGWDITGINNYNLPDASIYNIVTNIMNWLLGLIGVIGVIGFAISGILYLTAAGDETQIGKAKKAMTYSIIGVIVALVGLVVLNSAYYLLSAVSF